MIDYFLIKLIPADESHREFGYQVKKAAEGEYITQIWGWDEKVQIDFHAAAWQQDRPDIIIYNDKIIGTIAVIENEDDIEVKQFFILPEYQNKGIGSHLLKQILDNADKTGLSAKLKVLKINPAISLYRRYGFEIIDSNEVGYFMERKPGGSTNTGST